MTITGPDARTGAPGQAVVDAARLVLERMGLSPADLAGVPRQRPQVPTFADYVPVVSASVSDGTRRAYGSYWNRIVEHWGDRRLDEPTASDIRQLMTYVKTHAVARRNARGGRSAQEHLIHYGEAGKGGHFAALEQPEILVSEIRTGLRTLRS